MHLPATIDARPRHLESRKMFGEAYARVEYLFDPSLTWGGPPLMQWAYQVVHESFPHLDASQVQTLVAAMHRVYRVRRGHGARAHAVTPAVADPVNEPA